MLVSACSWTESWAVSNNTERSTGGGLFWGRQSYMFFFLKGHGHSAGLILCTSSRGRERQRLKQRAGKWGNTHIYILLTCVNVLMKCKLLLLQRRKSAVCLRNLTVEKGKWNCLTASQRCTNKSTRARCTFSCRLFTWRKSRTQTFFFSYSWVWVVVLCIVIIAVISNNEKQCVFTGWGRSRCRERHRKRGKEQPAVEHQRKEKREWLRTKREYVRLGWMNLRMQTD